jgi:hypothetical protein
LHNVSSRLSQFGIPACWWDPGAYPGSDASLTQWAWEFLRRNPDYRRCWEKVQPFFDVAAGVENLEAWWEEAQQQQAAWMQSNPAKGTAFKNVSPVQQMVDRFGACGDPRRGDYVPAFDVGGISFHVPLCEGALAALKGKSQFRGNELELKGNQVAVVFDCDRPINAQLARAKIILDQRRRARSKDAKEPRPRTDKFTSYLQILDAVDAGATIAEIAERLFPKLKDRYPEHRGAQRVRNHLAAARDLRGRGYLRLAAVDLHNASKT